jgi:hypothetical protein
MAIQLLLVAPAEPGCSGLRQFLSESGYEVMETSYGSSNPPLGDFRPDLVLVDHGTDIRARLAMRSHLGVDDSQSGVAVVEMCLSRPETFRDTLNVLERVSGARRRPRVLMRWRSVTSKSRF